MQYGGEIFPESVYNLHTAIGLENEYLPPKYLSELSNQNQFKINNPKAKIISVCCYLSF